MITKRDGTAYIDDTRIPVWSIVNYIKLGMTATDVIDDFENIVENDVYEALLYYAENRAEIDREIEENETA